MIKKTLYFGNPAYLSLRNKQLVMQLTMFRYLDHDTNQWVDKALLIADGKILDPNGFVIVKKGEATTGT